MLYILAVAMYYLVPILIIGGLIYLLRRKNGKAGTASSYFIAYAYFVIGAGVLTMGAGVGFLLTAAVSRGYSGGPIAEQILLGVVLLSTGLVVTLIHVWIKQLLKNRPGTDAGQVRRSFLFVMLGITSIAGLIAIPTALYNVVQRAIDSSPYPDPSGIVAAAIVVTILWAYYAYRVFGEVRGESRGEGDGQAV